MGDDPLGEEQRRPSPVGENLRWHSRTGAWVGLGLVAVGGLGVASVADFCLGFGMALVLLAGRASGVSTGVPRVRFWSPASRKHEVKFVVCSSEPCSATGQRQRQATAELTRSAPYRPSRRRGRLTEIVRNLPSASVISRGGRAAPFC